MAIGMNQSKAWALSVVLSSSIVGGLVGLMVFDAKKSLSARKGSGAVVVSGSDSSSLKVSTFETPADQLPAEDSEKQEKEGE